MTICRQQNSNNDFTDIRRILDCHASSRGCNDGHYKYV